VAHSPPPTPAPSGPSTGLSTQHISPGRFPESLTRHLIELQRGGFLARLRDRTTDLWKPDPAHQAVAANRLGWLDALPLIATHAAHLTAWARDARARFDTFALVGMGGSSLAPEVIARVTASPRDAARFAVLDSTNPDAIAALAARLDAAKALYIVSSKSGGTIETRSHAEFFWTRAGQRPGQGFVAITDPGSPLAWLAAERGFEHVFLNAPDIGGRYAALSLVGLVPAALLGLDVHAIAERTAAMVDACGPTTPTYDNPGLVLGALMGVAALNGADKFTLLTSPSLLPFAAWVEQLVAESTGKDGKGIIPVVGEPLDRMEFGHDRFVVALTLKDEPSPAVDEVLTVLRNSGTPVVEITLPDRMAVFGEFYKWEIASVVAASLLGVDPFDEPNVQESKDMTASILSRVERTKSFGVPAPVVDTDRLALWSAPSGPGATIEASLRAFLTPIKAPMYLALLGYLNPGPTVEAAMTRLRRLIGPSLGVPTLFGYGPRYLHSIGQLYKGGPPSGAFIILTSDHTTGLPIPGPAYTFGQLEMAQALGDFEALAKHARPVIRIHLKGDLATALGELERVVSASLTEH
jgi:glucose-6-phosphate isomerase